MNTRQQKAEVTVSTHVRHSNIVSLWSLSCYNNSQCRKHVPPNHYCSNLSPTHCHHLRNSVETFEQTADRGHIAFHCNLL